MDKTMPEIFREKRPKISDDDIKDAANKTRIALSFNAEPVLLEDATIATMSIKWALGDGTTETILLARYPATVLLLMLERLKENDWTGTILIPSDAPLH